MNIDQFREMVHWSNDFKMCGPPVLLLPDKKQTLSLTFHASSKDTPPPQRCQVKKLCPSLGGGADQLEVPGITGLPGVFGVQVTTEIGCRSGVSGEPVSDKYDVKILSPDSYSGNYETHEGSLYFSQLPHNITHIFCFSPLGGNHCSVYILFGLSSREAVPYS